MRELVWFRGQEDGREELQRLLRDALTARQPVYWLVPEPYSHETEVRLAEVGGASACLTAEVLSFALLSERVLTAEGGVAHPLLDEGGRLLTLRRALGTVTDSLHLFRRALSRPALLSGLLSTVDECKLYHIRPLDLERAAAQTEGMAAARLTELSLILGAYEALCAGGVMDSRDRYGLTAEKLREGSFGGGATVLVSDFYSFTPQERELLGTLADKAASVHIFLYGEPGNDLFRATLRTAAALQRRLPGLRERLAPGGRVQRAAALRYLEQYGHVPDAPPYEAAHEALELWRCGSAAEECRAAAERILSLCAKGLRYRDIHVLYPNDDCYGPLLTTIFPHYGIALFMDETAGVESKALFRCVRALLDCVLYGCRPADVTALLRCGLTVFTSGEIDRFEDYLTIWGFRGKGFTGQDFRKSPRGYGQEWRDSDEEELCLLNRIRRTVSDALSLMENRKKSPSEHAEALCAALEALDVREGLREQCRRLEREGYERLALENEQLWELFLHSLEQCAGVLAGESLKLEEFGELLFLTLSGYTVGSIPATLDAVRAGNIGRFARVPAPVVILLGAVEEAIPARSGGMGFWGVEERRALEALELELPPDELLRLEREELNIRTAFAMATDKLILSYPSEQNVPLAEDNAAVCVKRAAELLGVTPLTVPPPCYPVEREPEPPSPPPSLSSGSTRELFGATLELTPSRVRCYQECPFRFFMHYGLRLKERPRGGFDARLVGNLLHEVLEKTVVRITKMGGFAAVSLEEAEAAALAEAELCVRKTLHDGQAASARVAAQGRRVLDMTRRLSRCLWEELSESRFTPQAFELLCESGILPLSLPTGEPWGYRLSGKADRVDLCEQNGELLVRVVDYKSGRSGFGFTELYNGTGAQLLQYLFMLKDGAARYFPSAQGSPVAAGLLYLPTGTEHSAVKAKPSEEEKAALLRAGERRDGLLLGEAEVLRAMDRRFDSRETPLLPVNILQDGRTDKRSKVVNRSQMACLERFTKDLLQKTAEGIAAGHFAPRPLLTDAEDSACLVCDGRSVCGFDEETDEGRLKIAMGRDAFLAFLDENAERKDGED